MWRNPRTISKGLGKLTPQVWRGVMSAADFVPRNKTDIDKLIKYYIQDTRKRTDRPWFLAQLYACKRIEDNKYVYAWKRVQFTTDATLQQAWDMEVDNDFTSTQGSDPFAYAAVNTMETGNDQSKIAPGVDQGFDTYPQRFMMMPIGGVVPADSDDPRPGLNEQKSLVVLPVVHMWLTRAKTLRARYHFTASNTHDGKECTEAG